MRNITKLVAGAGLAAGSLLTLTVGATTAQASVPTDGPAAQAAQVTESTVSQTVKGRGDTYQGCPYKAVCIYPRDKGWNNGHPSNVYWSYGVHKLYNQVGNHIVFNNQSGKAGVWLCKGSNGTNCPSYLKPWTYHNFNLTPINSLKLVR